MGFYRNKWFKFALWGTLYLLWVVWLGNYWWLLGLPIIFDIYVSKKVRWAFWRPKNKAEKSKAVRSAAEWLDAVIFALVAAVLIKTFWFEAFVIPSSSMEKTLLTGDYLFVTKLAYGPKVPETPLSVPLVHNTIMGGESYSTLIQNKYRRLKGFSFVKRGDIVVFHFPNGDTVLKSIPMADYYQAVRECGGDRADLIRRWGPIVVRPRDKKDNYVKRCVAVAGDTLRVIDGIVYVNGVKEPERPEVQSSYTVVTKGDPINSELLYDLGINQEDAVYDFRIPGYDDMPLTRKEVEAIKQLPIVVAVMENIDAYPSKDSVSVLFPFTAGLKWTKDNYGPLYIPKKGDTVELTAKTLPLYERLITAYEGNALELLDGKIYINGSESTTYTFKQDYFWMMGDNRHNSLDSRYWGFVPEDHIIGAPFMIWFSSNKERSFPSNIRWNRLLKFVRHK